MQRLAYSIAMATHNGEKHLSQQLESFVQQSSLPDELVVVDDSSQDSTLGLLRDFEGKAPFRVRIFENPEALGVRASFSRAVSLCTGDYIFLSDQDDVWFGNKIERMLKVATSESAGHLLVCDTRYANEDLSELGEAKLEYVRRVKGSRSASHVMGCCTMITKEFASLGVPIPDVPLNHDKWLHDLASRLSSRQVMDDVLQLYRRHGMNASQGLLSDPKAGGRVRRIAQLGRVSSQDAITVRQRELEAMHERIEQATKEGAMLRGVDLADALTEVERELDACRLRMSLLGQPRARRIGRGAGMLLDGHYRFFSGWRSYVKDCLR